MSAPRIQKGPFWMADTPAIPRGFRAKIRWVLDHHPWIWLLVGLEQLATANIKWGVILLIVWVINLFIYETWESLSQLAKRITGRKMAFTFITIGAVCLAIGVTLLAKFPVTARVSNTTLTNVTPPPSPTPVVLSDEEKQFRFGLRAFVLSSLQEQDIAFTQFAGRLANTDSNTVFVKDRESTVAAGILLESLLRATYDPTWIALRKQADTTIEEIDKSAVMEKAQAYFKSYDESQIYFRKFLLLAGLDPTQLGMLSHWIDVDARAMQAFNNLVTSPLAGEFAHLRFVPASSRFAIYLTAPNNEKGGK